MGRLFRYVFALCLTLLATGSCVIEIEPPVRSGVLSPNALVITPALQDGQLVLTKSPGVDNLGENALVSLDIFVYKTNEGGALYKKYHLPKDAAEGTLTGDGTVDYQLESDWQQFYSSSETYRIYVAANNPQTHSGTVAVDFTETQLLALETTSPVTYNVYNDNAFAYDIVRLKGDAPTEWSDMHIANKVFMMDGKIDNWSPVSGETQQYFTLDSQNKRFNLTRAAAKINLEISFAQSFINQRVNTDPDNHPNDGWYATEWYDRAHTKPKVEEQITSVGEAQFKFVNFSPHTYDFQQQPSSASDPQEPQVVADADLWTSPDRFIFPIITGDASGGSYHSVSYQLITYTYGFQWTEEEAVEKAPAVLVSIQYTQKTRTKDQAGTVLQTSGENTTINYYRIPLVDESRIDAINRNHYYTIEAEIDSKGSSSLDDSSTEVDIKYKVLPWMYNQSTDQTTVEAKQLYYFTGETYYVLRGNDDQQVDLMYFTPVGYHPTISNVQVYYINDSGARTDITTAEYNNGNGTRTKIAVNSSSAGGGKIRITSTALANRAVKYIEFDASVTFDLGNNNTQTVTLHYKIKHFPLDNIQSVQGAWSSRWNGNYTTGTLRQYSFNPTADGWVAEGWSSWGDCEENIECTPEEYNRASDGKSTSTTTGTRTVDREVFLANVTTNDERTAANGQANAVNGYWGETAAYVNNVRNDPSTATSSDNWDFWSHRYYYGNRYGVGNYDIYNNLYIQYKYQNYYTNNSVTHYYARRYYRDITTDIPQTGSWVDWENRTGTTTNGYGYSSGYNNYIRFYAKYWGGSYCNNINYNNDGSYSGSAQTGLTNNHMYIIQISKAESGVVLGRPLIVNNQSQDNVVSPAFMIASQLGAVQGTSSHSTYGATGAANHCASYMEVSDNGRRFVGWRLPTQAEIDYIVEYQKATTTISGQGVFKDVLTGRWYYTLDGQYKETNYNDQTGQAYYVRCVRDLTPEEVEELNNRGTITSSTY